MKYSVIIPTMWRSERTLPMLRELDGCEFVKEIVIIDNEVSSCPDLSGISKLVYLPQKKNIYVNPAWNLGVETSTSEYFCILNDDISFDVSLAFKRASRCFNVGYTLIGLDQLSYDYIDERKVASEYYGFGCCIFAAKKEWKPIPDNFLIYFGDTWMVSTYSAVYKIVIDVETEMSTTSSSEEFSKMKETEHLEWQKLQKI